MQAIFSLLQTVVSQYLDYLQAGCRPYCPVKALERTLFTLKVVVFVCGFNATFTYMLLYVYIVCLYV